jgi:ribosomal-protein-alanine N-acetyltransferase
MSVRPMTLADRGAVAGIAEAAGLAMDVGAELEREWTRAWVATDNGNDSPVAFLVAWVVADELQVIQLATHPAARRRGTARRLLATLLEHGRRVGSRLVVLEVRRSNHAAIALYRSTGFRAIGLRKRYYESDGEDAVEMMLNLDADGNVEQRGDEILLERIS